MALDKRLLDLCETDPGSGFLRFYCWTEPTISLGYLEPGDVIDEAKAAKDGIAVVRRPTGGRAVLHGDDLSYAVVLPKPEGASLTEIYRAISEILAEGLADLGIGVDIERGKVGKSTLRLKPCFASVSRYEIIHRGRKVVGSAQRVGDRAILQHGSIPLGRMYLGIVDYMRGGVDPERARREMERVTACINDIAGRSVGASEVADALAKACRRRLL
jgi:lipoate-protein ligase A